ncbi:MAG: hypothetical protein RL497_2012 [Pseudomonadota bacterium]|jgi:phosphate/sulfate permease
MATPSTKTLYFSVISAVILLVSLTFQWNIIDIVTPFFILPFLGVAWFLVLLSVISGVVQADQHKSKGISAFLPLVISCSTLLAAFFIPFTQIWLYANFHLYKSTREKVVEKVKAGILVPNIPHNASLIALPEGTGVSMGGDEIVVEGAANNPYVFFYTFRGIMDNYSGFLWVPDGGKPEQFSDAAEPSTEIEALGGNWYFVGHR